MLVIDLNKGEVVKQIATEHQYSIMKRGRYICAATKNGTVNLLDPVSFAVVKSWNAHSALINDMDAQHDFIVTCGYSLRQGQTYMLDPFLNVFDIKKMSSMPPIPFPAGAAYVRMHPRMLTTSIVVSQSGQMHVVDLMNPNTSNVRQANVLTYLSMFEIAPSGESMALTDAECYIHLWGSPSKLHFVDLPTPIEFASPEEHAPQIEWTPETPLNSVGLPYYRDVLASAWPDLVSDVGAPPIRFDPQFLVSLKPTEFGLYGRNTRGFRRNQVEDTRNSHKSANSGLKAPKFLSEKARESAISDSRTDDKTDDVSSPVAENEIESKKSDVPVMYRNVEIKYSKFGVDDFDFGFYNKTRYSGLEIHISNSYANSLLQIMHFTPLIRNLALQHAATACVSEICLLCELGFLFDMLQKADGSICQATNLLRTLSSHPQAGPLGLLEEDPHGSSLNVMLQGLTRFLLDKIVSDYKIAHAEQEAPGQSQWHLFNDFLVRSVSTDEALTFNTSWKVPSVVAFQIKEANNKIDSTWKHQLDTSILYHDLYPNPNSETKTYHILDPKTERPGPDTIVALDTEFVAIRQPEIEMNSDGERETIRPIVYALARTSVVRGQGENEGRPFIDDYILIQEPIVDYLTSYSGITREDLDPRISKHSLLPLKMAYKKLWILLNLGCKFLGHGLKQDFRVINIHVPKSQVIDTIDLFFLKSRLRKLSLAFLAWYLLKEDIQMETHDSIEDSRTALKLYRKYLEFEDAGILETMLQDIYRAGRDVNFKPPRKDDVGVQRTDTPPLPVDSSTPGPSTPVRKIIGMAPGSGFGGGTSWTPGKGSPLR
ncbi:PAB-dependent poly(A)-specific ribonuclease subunit PAN2 [Metarhizium anisopliae]|nr:PAB-dependent poly(A)-specific ribonuclease subunit PAN2 [Metarhizium anisopliae]